MASKYPDGSIVMDEHVTHQHVADLASEIERLRSVVANQNAALAPFAHALKFARERLGKHPDINDATALAYRWITYDSLKEALGQFVFHKDEP